MSSLLSLSIIHHCHIIFIFCSWLCWDFWYIVCYVRRV